jgi:hypothetical protein
MAHRLRTAALPWTRLSDEELLKVRLCDLRVAIERSSLKPHIRRLYAELERRGIHFQPHVWLGEEWFSPDGVPGIAVPFYLAHPRLERLERRIMHTVEGGNARWLMRILRHEAGHALDNAYRLRRRKCWREMFGPASRPYPRTLSRPARQPPLRASPRRVVRAGAPHRGFCRDLCGVAEAALQLAQELRRLARLREAGARRGADGSVRSSALRCAAASVSSPSIRTRAPSRSTTAESSRATAIIDAAWRMTCCRRCSARSAPTPTRCAPALCCARRSPRSWARCARACDTALQRSPGAAPPDRAQRGARALRARQPPRGRARCAHDAGSDDAALCRRRDSAPAL